ncbi:MAG: hypothetical protein JNM63_18930, partial [Spirochaetia bacterium]|nr:hypothetical protein [Spirochaetia bacterium]
QDYYGSIEQYITAFFFWIFGPSIPLGGMIPLAEWSIAAGLGSYLCAKWVAGRSWIPALVAVIGVPYTLHYVAVPMNGFVPGIFIPILMAWIIDRAVALPKARTFLVFLLGLATGIGWYESKLMLPGAAALFAAGALVFSRNESFRRALGERAILWGMLFLTGVVVGYLPEILYRRHHQVRGFSRLADLHLIRENFQQTTGAIKAYFNAQPIGRIPESIHFFMRDVMALNRTKGFWDTAFKVLGISVMAWAFIGLLASFFRKQSWVSVFFPALAFLNIAAVVLSATTDGSFFNARRYLFASALGFSFLTGLFFVFLTGFGKWGKLAYVFLAVFLVMNAFHTYRLLGEPDQLRDIRKMIVDFKKENIRFGVAHYGYELLVNSLTDEAVVFAALDEERVPEYRERVSKENRLARIQKKSEGVEKEISFSGRVFRLNRTFRDYEDHQWSEYLAERPL